MQLSQCNLRCAAQPRTQDRAGPLGMKLNALAFHSVKENLPLYFACTVLTTNISPRAVQEWVIWTLAGTGLHSPDKQASKQLQPTHISKGRAVSMFSGLTSAIKSLNDFKCICWSELNNLQFKQNRGKVGKLHCMPKQLLLNSTGCGMGERLRGEVNVQF